MTLPIMVVALLFVGAATCIVLGIHMLMGTAWALIVAGLALAALGILLRSRLTPHDV